MRLLSVAYSFEVAGETASFSFFTLNLSLRFVWVSCEVNSLSLLATL